LFRCNTKEDYGADELRGGAGQDIINGGGGNDDTTGGNGIDTGQRW